MANNLVARCDLRHDHALSPPQLAVTFRTISYFGQAGGERGICQRAERDRRPAGSALAPTCRHRGPALIQAMLRP